MSRFTSGKKDTFLSQIPTSSIDNENCPLTGRSKFNFAYFDKQPASQNFSDWNPDEVLTLLEKLKEFSREPLTYWMNQPVGKSGTVFALYGAFPSKSGMKHPKHIPHEVQWGRFRLDWSGHLCGFIVPRQRDGEIHPGKKARFDCNTFYAVFLDKNHEFYKGKEAK